MTTRQAHIALGVIAIVGIAGLVIVKNSSRYAMQSGVGYDGSVTTQVGSSEMAFDKASAPMVASGDIVAMEDMGRTSFFPPSPGGSVAVDVLQEDRLIVKNGSLSLVVDHVQNAVGRVASFAIENGGFVVTSNIDNYERRPSGYVHIRIPSEVFDTGLDELRAIGQVQSESVDGRDVTEEFVDLEAQLKNYQATEAQFLEIMKDATEIQDILAVQRELMTVRSSIEYIQGHMKYLTESAAFSSLMVYLSTDPEDLPVFDEGDTWKPLATVKNALRGLLDLGKDILDIIIWIVIFVPVWGVLYLLYRIGRRWYQSTRQQ